MWPFLPRKVEKKDPVLQLVQGRDCLWQGQAEQAITLLTEYSDRAIHLAYRSLAHRMDSRFSMALDDANSATTLAPSLLEGQFALSVAQLSAGDVVSAVATFNLLKTSSVYDHEGHFCNLLAIILYAQCIMNMHETADELRLNFIHTPVTRAAIYVLDAKATQALYELSKSADNDLLSLLATALATYRNGLWGRANKRFRQCLEYVERTKDPFQAGASLNALIVQTARMET